MKRTLTVRSHTTAIHEYTIDVDVPEGADLAEWFADEVEHERLELFNARRHEVSYDLKGLTACDEDNRPIWSY